MGAGNIWKMESDHLECDDLCAVCDLPMKAGELCLFILVPPEPAKHFGCVFPPDMAPVKLLP